MNNFELLCDLTWRFFFWMRKNLSCSPLIFNLGDDLWNFFDWILFFCSSRALIRFPNESKIIGSLSRFFSEKKFFHIHAIHLKPNKKSISSIIKNLEKNFMVRNINGLFGRYITTKVTYSHKKSYEIKIIILFVLIQHVNVFSRLLS